MRKIISISLSLLLLVSSANLTLATHFCAGKAVETELSLVKGGVGCGMADAEKLAAVDTDIAQFSPVPCCENTYQVIAVEDDFNHLSLDYSLDFYISSFITWQPNLVQAQYFNPIRPILNGHRNKNLQISFQQFLI